MLNGRWKRIGNLILGKKGKKIHFESLNQQKDKKSQQMDES